MADLELLVADDGSEDNTAEVVTSFSDKRVKYLSLPHQGRSLARNSGIQQASGQYIAFLDADDWWKKDKLAKQVSLFKRNEQLGLVYCWLQQVGPDGQMLRTVKGIDNVGNGEGDWIFRRLLFGNIGGPGSAAMVSRTCLEKIGGFRSDLSYAEDWDFCLRAAYEFPVGYVPEELAFYLAHGFYLPEKYGRLAATEASLTAVKNALSTAAIASDDPLYREAVATTLWNCCLQSVGNDNFVVADDFLSEALLLKPEIFAPSKRNGLAQSIGYYANTLYDTLTPLDQASAYVHKLFKHLAKGRPQLASVYRSSLGWTYAIHAFEGQKLGVPQRTRSAFWQAMLHDPVWLRNVGLWSVGIRACAPAGSTREL